MTVNGSFCDMFYHNLIVFTVYLGWFVRRVFMAYHILGQVNLQFSVTGAIVHSSGFACI